MSTVGILYPGEMGASLGSALAAAGVRVVTTVEGRSARTRRLGTDAGLPLLDSAGEVVRAADVVVSLVPPAAALAAAAEFVTLSRRGSVRPLYVDANSISPQTAAEVERLLAGEGLSFVDASIHGLASRLSDMGSVYLSGPRAAEVESLIGGAVRTRVLGDTPGAASAFKMLLAGMSKGLVALFLEMSLAAREAGVLDQLLAGYGQYYPGVMDAVGRLLPTYPQHARRRADELGELEATMRELGRDPQMVSAARRIIDGVGELELNGRREAAAPWSLRQVVEAIYAGECRQHDSPLIRIEENS